MRQKSLAIVDGSSNGWQSLTIAAIDDNGLCEQRSMAIVDRGSNGWQSSMMTAMDGNRR
jgi:hypothetical protein